MKRRNLLLGAGAGTLGGILAACGGSGGTDDATLLSDDSLDDASSRRRPGTTPVDPNPPSQPKARVIVVGGGMAGATVAKYLRMWGDQVDVTLVERANSYTACLLSSLVLTGQRTLSSLSFSYDTLRSTYGIRTVFGDVVAIDPATPSVTLGDGQVLVGDRLVLAPGIDFDEVPGLAGADPLRMPHAWKAGPQTTALAQQLAAMPAGGTMVLTVPPTPYRCPPGPYERACLVADWMKARKPGSKLIVLDANPDIVAERDNFTQAFLGLHASVIEYHTNVAVHSADPAAMALETSIGRIQAQVINLIPRQRAGALVTMAGLNNSPDSRFAAVDVLDYRSTAAPKVHVIGDACGTTQPKSGHIANQEAKVCADALVRSFAGLAPDPAPVTSSACFSTITMRQAAWLSALFQYDPATRQMVSVPAAAGASNGWNSDGFEDMGTWFRSITSDTFA